MRTVTTILIGAATGILGFDGPIGILFYAVMDVIVSLLLLLRFGCKKEPHWLSLSSVFNTGLFPTNFMTFMVSWVLFFNIVYIL